MSQTRSNTELYYIGNKGPHKAGCLGIVERTARPTKDLSQSMRTMALLNIGLARSMLRGVVSATRYSIGILASKTNHQLGIT